MRVRRRGEPGPVPRRRIRPLLEEQEEAGGARTRECREVGEGGREPMGVGGEEREARVTDARRSNGQYSEIWATYRILVRCAERGVQSVELWQEGR